MSLAGLSIGLPFYPQEKVATFLEGQKEDKLAKTPADCSVAFECIIANYKKPCAQEFPSDFC